MSTSDLLIHARWIVQPHAETLLEGHAVAVQEGKILDILPSEVARQRYADAIQVVELPEHALLPGLINLHTHAAMALMRGIADDLPLMPWLTEHIWPAESRFLSPRFVHDGVLLAAAEMLAGGITCFNDMYYFLDDAAEAVREVGMRAVLGIVTLEFPSPWAGDADAYLERGLAAHERWRHEPRLAFSLAPHAPYTVGDRSFEKIRTLSAQLELPIHLHLHETDAEIRDHRERYGCRPLARLERLGLLGPQLIAVHAVHLETAELEQLATYNCNIAHCPTSNLKLASGIAPVADMLARKINVGLGSDGAASNNRLDLFQEMRLASLLAKGQSGDASALPAWQALQMASCNAARALGQENAIGTLAPGWRADLVAVQLDAFPLAPCFDPVSHLVHCAGREQVTHVWVDGECCVFEKELQRLSTAHLNNLVRLWQNRLARKADSGKVASSAKSDMIAPGAGCKG